MSIFSKLTGSKGRKPSGSKPTAVELEGVITFFGAHHALKGEKILSASDIRVLLIPGPREISPNCGTALRFDFSEENLVGSLLEQNNVLFEKIHHYPV